MISQTALQNILGIEEVVHLTPKDMVGKVRFTFSPETNNASANVLKFVERLKRSFERLNISVISYDSVWVELSWSRRLRRFFKYAVNDLVWLMRKLFRMSEVNFYIPLGSLIVLSGGKRIQKNVCIICAGEQSVDKLPMRYISNFKDNSIITILDFPSGIHEKSSFDEHFNASMSLFAYHMTNIVIAVNDSSWMLYNFNVSHPVYSLDSNNFDSHILKALVPKIVAPISPHKFSEFRISNMRFDVNDDIHGPIVGDMKKGGELFTRTKLYPQGKKIHELPFRHSFHSLIGRLHLDSRNGMSFGFLAFQMPTRLPQVLYLDEFKDSHPQAFVDNDMFIDPSSKDIFVLFDLKGSKIVLEVPEVWVMTLRSGSNKTRFDPLTDLLKLGLVKGEMWMEFPRGLKIDRDYKPSFDTKVILAHAVGNAMIAAILKRLDPANQFAARLEKEGVSISHWHGYFNEEYIPAGIHVYGRENPHVSCSSPQSAIYALGGKINSFFDILYKSNGIDYTGDIHVEPHHGINITFPSLTGLAEYLLHNPMATELGNKYL